MSLTEGGVTFVIPPLCCDPPPQPQSIEISDTSALCNHSARMNGWEGGHGDGNVTLSLTQPLPELEGGSRHTKIRRVCVGCWIEFVPRSISCPFLLLLSDPGLGLGRYQFAAAAAVLVSVALQFGTLDEERGREMVNSEIVMGMVRVGSREERERPWSSSTAAIIVHLLSCKPRSLGQ